MVAVAQQHAERESNMQNGKATCRTGKQHAERESNMQNGKATCRTGKQQTERKERRRLLCGALIIDKVKP